MKKTLISFILFLIGTFAFSQDIIYKVGDVIDVNLNAKTTITSEYRIKHANEALQKASTNFTIGTSLTLFTGAYALLSTSIIPVSSDPKKEKDLKAGRCVIGVSLATAAVTELILGYCRLNLAKMYLGKDAEIVLSLSSTELGLSVSF